MRKLAILSLFLLIAGTTSAALLTRAAWAQDEPDFGHTELHFDLEGEDFDPEIQRAVEGVDAAAGIFFVLIAIVWLAVLVLVLASMWVLFTKAGKPGWAAIIPIYNVIVLLEIIGRPLWWILLLFIPCVNFVVPIILFIDLAKSFGKDALFGVGLWLLGFIFFPILAFGDAKYQGPSAAQ